MRGSPKQFLKNRRDPVTITNKRVKDILSYVIYCYEKLVSDAVVYSRQWVKDHTAHTLEDYLKMEFVERYLIPNKSYVQQRISQLEQISFNYETQKRYVDAQGTERVDKIDIYINKIGLQDLWQVAEEHLYLAIECKRIAALSDNGAYMQDIEKFCERKHLEHRLPHEGMIAFIENTTINSRQVSDDLNVRLIKSAKVKTNQYLKQTVVKSGYADSYSSQHERNSSKTNFSIHHLYFDYSNIILS